MSLVLPRSSAQRLLMWSVLCAVAAGMGVFAVAPRTLLIGFGHPLLAGAVHLFTLGGLVGTHYVLQERMLVRVYGEPGPWRPARWTVALLHLVGLAVMTYGFFTQNWPVVYLGGHYLLPTAIALSFVRAATALWRRPAGRPRNAAVLLPGLGLLAVMALGAMLVLDAYRGGYGFYGLAGILLHLLSGMFLFYLPLVLLGDLLQKGDEPPDTGPALLPTAVAALGVLAAAYGAAGMGGEWGWPLGLAVLGGVAMWVGLPAFGSPMHRSSATAFAPVRRMPWSAFGVLLLFAAIRHWRGMPAVEGLTLATFGVLLFFAAVALPDALSRLNFRLPATGAPGQPPPDFAWTAGHYVVHLVAAGLLLGASLSNSPLLVRLGAALWLGALLSQAVRLWQLESEEAPASPPLPPT